MSVEFLVLLALFTLLPIIEQAWRKHREARERASRRARGLPPVPPPMPPPLPRVPPGHAPLPSRPEALDDDVEVAVVVLPAKRPKPVMLKRPVMLPQAAPRVMVGTGAIRRPVRPRGTSVRALVRDADALRRGVVLLTVLGPCRANVPYDS